MKADRKLMPVFTPQTAAKHARKAHAHRKESSLSTICDMQAALRADVLNEEVTPAHRAQAARAWKELESQKLVLKGIGVPRPVDYRDKRKTQSSTSGPLEPIPEEKPEV